jgi:hypothetical protein
MMAMSSRPEDSHLSGVRVWIAHIVLYNFAILQTWRFLDKLYSQSMVIFRTWVPSADYISLESLNCHHFLLCSGFPRISESSEQ